MLPKHEACHVWVDGVRHYQTPIGVFPGVTSVLHETQPPSKAAVLAAWKNRVGEAEAERIRVTAAARGTAMHNAIERVLVGELANVEPVGALYLDSMSRVLAHVDDVQLVEGAVWHPAGFAGSIDCVGRLLDRMNGEVGIIDWKTSDRLKRAEWIDDYRCQVAAYAAAANRVYQELGLRIRRACICVAIPGTDAQVFELEPDEMLHWWRVFSQRCESFHAKGKH